MSIWQRPRCQLPATGLAPELDVDRHSKLLLIGGIAIVAILVFGMAKKA
jgi:hypothetical protein